MCIAPRKQNFLTLLLASLTFGFALAAAPGASAQIEFLKALNQELIQELNQESAWTVEEGRFSSKLRVQSQFDSYGQIRTTVRLPDGAELELDPIKNSYFVGLNANEVAETMKIGNEIFRSSAELVYNGRFVRGVTVVQTALSGDAYYRSMQMNEAWARANQVFEFSPIEEFIRTKSTEPKAWRDRLRDVLSFLHDAVYRSTIEAFKSHRNVQRGLKGKVVEFGFELIIKIEIQLGVGGFNITKNFPWNVSIGYSREHHRIVFRAGRRSEFMTGGTGMSFALKVEPRIYRRFSSPLGGKALPFDGQSWYPPSIPFFGLVADSAHGYVSEGLVFGLNAADIIPGTWLMNTVNKFNQEHRVFFAPLPKAMDWRKRLVPNVGSYGPLRSCESLFAPAH